jgi:hypothetical protein
MCIDCLPQLPNSQVTGPVGPAGADGLPGRDGVDGVYGGVCAHYKFSDVVTVGGTFPGVGLLKFNSANLLLATRLDICYADFNGNDLTAFINTISIPTSTIKALIRITSKDDESKYEFFEVTGFTSTGTGVSGWAELTVVNIGASLVVPPFNPWIPADDILFCPTISGDSAFNMTDLNVALDGTNYPASSAGDVYRIMATDASGEGRLGCIACGTEPPTTARVYQDDLLYCITDTAGGDTATAGSSFFVFTKPRAFVPFDKVNGSSNFRFNGSGNITNPNLIGAGTNEFNLLIGLNNAAGNSAQINLLLGDGNTISGSLNSIITGLRNAETLGSNNSISGQFNNVTSGVGNAISGNLNIIGANSTYNNVSGASNRLTANNDNNIIGGLQNTILTGGDNNIVGGYLNSSINGNNNIVAGSQNTVIGSNMLVIGASHAVGASSVGASFASIIGGNGSSAIFSNSLYLGATTSPGSFHGTGTWQTILAPIIGYGNVILSPASQFIRLATNIFSGTNDNLSMPLNSEWSWQAHIIVTQTGVGVIHTNTSTQGDRVEYVVTGTSQRTGAGTLTVSDVKWLDHRNRWIPSTTPDPICYRSRAVTTGTNADICLVQPRVVSPGSGILAFEFVFPGDAEAMPDQGALHTPRFAYYFDDADVLAAIPAIGTPATTDGVMTNNITTAGVFVPAGPPLFKFPALDISDGDDANGTGYYGGIGIGATASAVTDGTSGVEYVTITDGGNYTGPASTITFVGATVAGPVATANTTMTASEDHVGLLTLGAAGGGYTPSTTFSLAFSVGTAAGTATSNGAGAIINVTLTSKGTGCGGVTPTVTIVGGGGGVGAVITATIYYAVTGIAALVPGLYNNILVPTVTFAGVGLSQAAGEVVLVSQGIVGGTGAVTVNTGGRGYGVSYPKVAGYDLGTTAAGGGNGGSFKVSGNILISQVKYA